MKLEIQYPVFVIAKSPDAAPLTFIADGGAIAYPVFETEAEAERLISARQVASVAPIKVESPRLLLGALRMAALKAKANLVLLPRGTSPESDDGVLAAPMPTVLRYVEQQAKRADKAEHN